MAVALVALIAGAGGGAAAATLITSADIQDNTIRSVDVRDGTVQSIDVADGSLTGADVASNSITGADVNESTLGRVPLAVNSSNAANVDGLDANSLTRVSRMSTLASLLLTTAPQTHGTALSITAPAAGFVMIHGRSTLLNPPEAPCTTACDVFAYLRHVETGVLSVHDTVSVRTGFNNTSHAWVFPVNPGVNTFDLRLWRSAGDGALFASVGQLAAIYSPFGSTGDGNL